MADRAAVQLLVGSHRKYAGWTDEPDAHESGELHVEFERRSAPLLPKGAKVELELTAGGNRTELFGTVQEREVTREATRYRVRVRPAAAPRELDGGGANNRDAFRVRPPVAAPIDVKVTGTRSGAEHEVLCRLRDISVSGVALVLAPEAKDALRTHERITLEFALPSSHPDGEPDEIRVRAIVRYARLSGLITHCGVQFELGRGPESQTVIDCITKYVVRRQREQIEGERGGEE